MIDRIEELLGSLAAEEDEEEQEDVLARKRGKAVSEGAWTGSRVSDGATIPSDRPETEGKRPSDLTALQRDNGPANPRTVNRRSVATEKREPGDRSGGRTAGEIILERPGSIAGETMPERARASRELWKDGPVWTVQSVEPEMDEVYRTATAGRTAQVQEIPPPRDGNLIWSGPQWTAQGVAPGLAPDGAARAGLEQAGLKGLYRQTVGGLRPAAPALPPEQAGRNARAQEPGSAASLAVDELDRAVRRDSRRYDGGMSIY